MSLINDALRKARQAAAEHEEQRTPHRAPRAYPGRGRDARPSVWLLVAVAAIAAIAGGATVWWLTIRGPGPEPAARVRVEAVEHAGAAELSEAESGTEPGDTASSDGGTVLAGTPDEPAPLSGVDAASGAPEPDAVAAAEVPPAGDTVGADTARGTDAGLPSQHRAVSAGAPSRTGDEDGRRGEDAGGAAAQSAANAAGSRVFVLDATVDGRSLSLGYIVFRPVRPFAEINGDDVYEGSEVAGFTVERIEADRVILRDARGPLELRTR